ncbi:MAG: selenocysteine-specific translation elongation factor [Deltaproteobacteria bacterium]|nr:MAG: selenocysteine-specific translation elongation factor [Deltaproteobacteria bacterium]
MKHVIVGTAGHIDHGKTTLIKALTGVDCDRLIEEKKRGITIELGFASMRLPDGTLLGIVDVPGHERFVRHMVAGAAGIDIVMLVVAADDGVNAQTREHLDILRILDVKSGMTVLTKIDLVDPEWLELVEEDLADTLAGTFLEKAPILPCSAHTGEGLEQIVATLGELAQRVEEKPAHGPLRLPIDRVFTMKGFGTVVTGTLVSGSVRVGENVTVMPQGLRGKVRGLQVHNEKVEEARAGMRTAVNLQGIEREEIRRGDVLTEPDRFSPSRRLDVELFTLPTIPRPLKHRVPVRIHHGTREVIATPILLGDRDAVGPDERVFAQLLLSEPIVASPKERFVVRSYSPMTTIGGGILLDLHASRHRRRDAQVLAELTRLRDGDLTEQLHLWIGRSHTEGITLDRLETLVTAPRSEIEKRLEELEGTKQILSFEMGGGTRGFVLAETFAQLRRRVLEVIESFHARHPLRKGPAKEEVRSRISAEEHLLETLLADMIERGEIVQEGESLRLASFTIELDEETRHLEAQIAQAYREGGVTPPLVKEIEARFPGGSEKIHALLALLVSEERLVRVSDTLLFDKGALDELTERLVAFLETHGGITPTEFKSLGNLSRKYAIPLLEYYDAIRLTMRVGEKRVLRKRNG